MCHCYVVSGGHGALDYGHSSQLSGLPSSATHVPYFDHSAEVAHPRSRRLVPLTFVPFPSSLFNFRRFRHGPEFSQVHSFNKTTRSHRSRPYNQRTFGSNSVSVHLSSSVQEKSKQIILSPHCFKRNGYRSFLYVFVPFSVCVGFDLNDLPVQHWRLDRLGRPIQGHFLLG